MTDQTAAAGFLVASAVVFGVAVTPILRNPAPEDLSPAERDRRMAEAGAFNEWVAATLGLGLAALSIDAFGRFVEHYRTTGELMSPEEIERTYE